MSANGALHKCLQCVFVTLVIGPEGACPGCWGCFWLADVRGEEWEGSARPAVRLSRETARKSTKGTKNRCLTFILCNKLETSKSASWKVCYCLFFVCQSKCFSSTLRNSGRSWWDAVLHLHSDCIETSNTSYNYYFLSSLPAEMRFSNFKLNLIVFPSKYCFFTAPKSDPNLERRLLCCISNIKTKI